MHTFVNPFKSAIGVLSLVQLPAGKSYLLGISCKSCNVFRDNLFLDKRYVCQ